MQAGGNGIGKGKPATTTYATYVFTESANIHYTDALAAATSSTINGTTGHLLAIESAQENETVYQWLSTSLDKLGTTWLAISDAAEEGTWVYTAGPYTNQELLYTNWLSGQPDNNLGMEDLAIYSFQYDFGQWIDYTDSTYDLVGYVTEYENLSSPPSSLIEQSLTIGSDGTRIVVGNDAQNTILGANENDQLYGLDGNDVLAGYMGADKFYGGLGADVFFFNSELDSPNRAKSDIICDFNAPEGDKIALSFLSDVGINDVTFVNSFSGSAGEAIFKNNYLSIDVDGDTKSDFSVKLIGVTSLTTADILSDYLIL